MLFKNHFNRLYFLKRFSYFMDKVCTNNAFSLFNSEGQFVIQIHDRKVLNERITSIPVGYRTISMNEYLLDVDNDPSIGKLVERQINSFMVSYTLSFNKVYKRQGGLFQSPFRRSIIKDDRHLQRAIIYTHCNAQKHGLIRDFRNYPYSSYCKILSGHDSFVDVAAVIELFGGINNFIEQHRLHAEHKGESPF